MYLYYTYNIQSNICKVNQISRFERNNIQKNVVMSERETNLKIKNKNKQRKIRNIFPLYFMYHTVSISIRPIQANQYVFPSVKDIKCKLTKGQTCD